MNLPLAVIGFGGIEVLLALSRALDAEGAWILEVEQPHHDDETGDGNAQAAWPTPSGCAGRPGGA